MRAVDMAVSLDPSFVKLLREGAAKAKDKGKRVLVSATLPAPQPFDLIDVFARSENFVRDRFYWSAYGGRLTLLGIGSAQVIERNGADRFGESRRAWEELVEDALIAIDETCREHASQPLLETVEGVPPVIPPLGPVLMGNFAFRTSAVRTGTWNSFPDSRLVLPQAFLMVWEGNCSITWNAVVEPTTDHSNLLAEVAKISDLLSSTPTRAESTDEAFLQDEAAKAATEVAPLTIREIERDGWKGSIPHLTRAIRDGRLEKVVVAREVEVLADGGFSPSEALRALKNDYPECYIFCTARDDVYFMGATPERLIAREGAEVYAMALAGSTGRGESDAADSQLGEKLMTDEKELHEHQLVIHALMSALEPLCSEVRTDARTGLFKLGNVQHLHTPVRARLKHMASIIDLAERVHPTPAVGGYPKKRALDYIDRTEFVERGWYAGPVGWVGPDGDGEFAVAIRSALISGDRASLFAGCGIVEGSDPEAEYKESLLKLRPMLRTLERARR